MKNTDVAGLDVQLTLGAGVVGLVLSWLSLSGTFGPPQEPVRYMWGNGKHCVVIYPDKREVSCASFTKEELNEFRLEYMNPHRIVK